MDKVAKRLDSWKRAYFSFGARITLLQSCLANLPIYFLTLFRIPRGVARDFEKIMRGFLWSGVDGGKRDHLVKWAMVQKPKEEGGLGIGNLTSKNTSLLENGFGGFRLNQSHYGTR